MEREFASAPEDVRSSIRWAPLGVGIEVDA
jgi:hypothetical protein